MKKKNLKLLKLAKMSVSNLSNSVKGGTYGTSTFCSIERCGEGDNTNIFVCAPGTQTCVSECCPNPASNMDCPISVSCPPNPELTF